MQFHHDGESHWLLSHSDGSEVFVYDSIYNRPNYMVKQQLCHVTATSLEMIYYALIMPKLQSRKAAMIVVCLL